MGHALLRYMLMLAVMCVPISSLIGNQLVPILTLALSVWYSGHTVLHT